MPGVLVHGVEEWTSWTDKAGDLQRVFIQIQREGFIQDKRKYGTPPQVQRGGGGGGKVATCGLGVLLQREFSIVSARMLVIL